ncbi:MAG: TM1812 family CRISPR-associated protein [Clostridia bacterium]|nr:TM1812 family CRISPR-associated protein [Clostridia bacterium]
MSNILFTTLSLTSDWEENNYFKENRWCRCVQQQEPGAKYFLSTQIIDRIVIFGTIETLLDSTRVRKWDGNPGALSRSFKQFEEDLSADWRASTDDKAQYSAYEKLMFGLLSFLYTENDEDNRQAQKQLIAADLQSQDQPVPPGMTMMRSCQPADHPIRVIFIPNIDENGADNIDGLMKALTGTENDPARVYMDMQGGARTKIYVNNAVLQMLTESGGVYHTSLAQAVATNFAKNKPSNEIVDETDQYKIVELVSGMTAFLKYGKADVISEYLNALHENDARVQALVNAMNEIDLAITFSRLGNEEEEDPSEDVDLLAAVDHLREALKHFETKGYSSSVKKIFDILLEAIREDFGDLLKGDSVSVVALVEWLVKKNNLFVASSVMESKLPTLFVRSGLLYYARYRDELQTAEDYFRLYLIKGDRPLFQFRDINHFFIKYYVPGCTYGFQWGNKDLDAKTRNHASILPPYHKESNMDYPLRFPSSYPIPMYSDYPTEIGKVLVLYFYIAQYRNSGAHSSQSAFDPNDVRNAMRDIIGLLKSKNPSKRSCLNGSAIHQWYQQNKQPTDQKKSNSVLIPQKTIDEVWRKCLLAEINCPELFGKGHHPIVRAQKPLSNLPGYYALGRLYFGVKYLKENWNALQSSNTQRHAEILKDNAFAPFLQLWVNYCNSQLEENQQIPPYETLRSLRYITATAKKATTQDAVASIKKALTSYADFASLLPYLHSEQDWTAYVEQTRTALQAQWDQKGIDPETEINVQHLDKLWHSIASLEIYDKQERRKVSYPDWKALIRYYCGTDALVDELVKTIKSI